MNLIYMLSDEDYIYSIMEERYSNKTYFIIHDRFDNMRVKTKIPNRFRKLILTEDGCWVTTLDDEETILFRYDGSSLYRYDED